LPLEAGEPVSVEQPRENDPENTTVEYAPDEGPDNGDANHESSDDSGSAPISTVSQTSWKPLSFQVWSLSLLFALLIIANAFLIYFFVQSERSQGIAPASSIPILVRRFVPTAGKLLYKDL
jgi:hypothetical protein